MPPDHDEPGPTNGPSGPSSSGPTEGIVETTECPSCGRRFVGAYCPDCGQEATPTTSTGGVLDDFLRELLDIERGFLETAQALTVTPGRALRAYLRGDRRWLMSPGRYLLATLVIQYVAIRSLMWTGVLNPVRRSAVAAPRGLLSEDVPAALVETVARLLRFAQSQEGQIVAYLVVVTLLALALRRLFASHLPRLVNAVAVSSFIVGHAVLLETAAHLIWVPATRVLVDTPANPVSQPIFSALFGVALVVFLGYVGWVSYSWFGPGLWSVAKGLLGAFWALVEAEAVFVLLGVGYLSWWIRTTPAASGLDGSALASLGILCTVPFLVHAVVEAFIRLRDR